MRNQTWKIFSELARKSIDFRNYFYFGDVWTPNALSQGDIIRVDLPTDYRAKGDYEICARNCVVMGLDIDLETMEPQAIRVMRLSYSVNETSPDYEVILDPTDPAYRLKIPGIKHAAVLRTGKVEILPINSQYFGFCIDRIGSINSQIFKELQDPIAKGFEKRRKYNANDSLYVTGLRNTIFVPSLDPHRWDSNEAIALQEAVIEHDTGIGLNYASLDVDTQRAMQDEMNGQLAQFILDSQHQRYVEISQTRKLSNAEKQSVRANRKLRRAMARGYSDSHMPRAQMMALIQSATRAFTDDYTEGSVFDIDTKSNPLLNVPDLKALLEEKFGLRGSEVTTAVRLPEIFSKQAIDPNSLADLESLGIGGLIREPSIVLPKQLWRGRYMMMRIPNLAEPDEMSQDVYRPCALWKAYAKVDETGQPVLVGLELHPCTRGAAHLYSYKQGVRPLDTVVKMPTYLIADIQIRAPISAEYFQPTQPSDGTFYELLPEMVDAFEIKRTLASDKNGSISTYGLQTIPADWVEINLPPAPNERLRKNLGRNRMRFVPT